VRPNHDVWTFRGPCGKSETVDYVFGRVDRDLDRKISFKPFGNRFERMASSLSSQIQKLAIDPGEQVHRNQKKSRKDQQQPLRWKKRDLRVQERLYAFNHFKRD
jgi:hypothetical protein